MEKEKVGLYVKNNPNVLNLVKKFLEKKDKIVVIYDKKVEFDSILALGQDLKNKNVNRGIAIDEYGNLPFMILGKLKGVVCAQISDAYSAHMTMEHNNATSLALGYKLLQDENMLDILNLYINEHFAAGRHMVRIDMMNSLQEGEN